MSTICYEQGLSKIAWDWTLKFNEVEPEEDIKEAEK